MGYTYEWKLTGIKKQNTDQLSDVVVNTYWHLKGIDENGYSGSFTGATPFRVHDVDPNNFTSYENLTEEQVLGWIKHHVSSSTQTGYWDHISDRIQKDINNKKGVIKNVDTFDLPWSPSSGSISGSVPI